MRGTAVNAKRRQGEKGWDPSRRRGPWKEGCERTSSARRKVSETEKVWGGEGNFAQNTLDLFTGEKREKKPHGTCFKKKRLKQFQASMKESRRITTGGFWKMSKRPAKMENRGQRFLRKGYKLTRGRKGVSSRSVKGEKKGEDPFGSIAVAGDAGEGRWD